LSRRISARSTRRADGSTVLLPSLRRSRRLCEPASCSSGAGRCSPDPAFVRSIIYLAKALELSVVAEGVETEASATRLAELGCETAQGYFFARPLTKDAFGEWLLTHREACVLAG